MAVDASWMQWPTLGHAPAVICEVVGESYRQEALEAICGGRCDDGVINRLVTAELTREPKNKHDRNAVRVDVGGHHVGYVAADEAPAWHRVLDHLAAHDFPATCRAELTGGWQRGNRDVGSIGVVLWCDRRPRDESDPFLPSGDRVSVVGEQHHQDVISNMPTDTCAVVELRAGERIGVHWRGYLVGELTEAMTARYAALVEEVIAAGLPASCRASVARGPKKLDIHLELIRPANIRRQPAKVVTAPAEESWAAPLPPAAWLADPTGRHEARWWDGSKWTEHVADGGQAGIDPPV
jgi:hypothetical protein